MYCLISIFRCVHCVYTHMKYFSDNKELHISLLRHCVQSIIFHKVDVPGPLLGRDPLFPLWFAYGRFDSLSNVGYCVYRKLIT